jgi:SAM-dependent methyltransferase
MPIPLLSIALFIAAGIMTYLFVVGFIWGAGYYPTPNKEIINAGELLEIKPGSTIYDLGCGFGKVVFTLAKRYPESKFLGVDIDPVKTGWCNFAVKLSGFSGRVRIIRQNILGVDLSDATRVYIFLSEETRIMEHLREKMFDEMKPGSLVVSYVHRFQSWEPSAQKGDLRLYIVPCGPSSPQPSAV